jgi:hypothetical protein
MVALSKAEGKQIFSGLPPKRSYGCALYEYTPSSTHRCGVIGTIMECCDLELRAWAGFVVSPATTLKHLAAQDALHSFIR